MVIGEL